MDLLDWHRERLSARRLAVLIKQLPRDSALNRELHGEAAEWSMSDHLLAAAVDHLAAANWMFACVNSEKGDQPDAPTPVPRPSYTAEQSDGDAVSPGEPGAQAPPGVQQPGDRSGGRPGDHADATPSAVQLARFFA
ncbi:hypothetical protein ABZT34_22305 [Streptomyces sp. NPDC005329]|uniref:hypothetical protein n=1 Tax=Streptomyces sp. NPDC005329 TaxID=3157034 RepID=UPI0033B2FDD9